MTVKFITFSAIALVFVLAPHFRGTATATDLGVKHPNTERPTPAPSATPQLGGEQLDREGTMTKLGMTPNYPSDRNCSPLTSLFRSWTDTDGSRRDEVHTGVDAGRLGDPILAPASGVVIAVWQADWGWGNEGALLIRHSRADVGLADGPQFYYSEFDHLKHDEIRTVPVGKRIQRGERLASVFRPGGKRRFLPEVHWEVWSVPDDAATSWSTNKFGKPFWQNKTADLVDPVYMLSLDSPPRTDGSADIVAFDRSRDYSGFRGFTYILPCPRT